MKINYIKKQIYKLLRNKLFKFLLIIFILIIIFLGLFDVNEISKYNTIKPERQDIYKKINFKTSYKPDKYIKIDLPNKSEIKKIRVKTGDFVKKGSVIAELNDSEEQLALNSSLANFNSLVQTRDTLRNSQNKFKKDINLLKKKGDKNIKDIGKIIEDDENLTDDQKSILMQQLVFVENTSKVTASVFNTISGIDLGGVIQSSINFADKSVKNAKKAIEDKKIKAPFSGYVLFLTSDNISFKSNASNFDLESLTSGVTSVLGLDIPPIVGSDYSDNTKYSNNFSFNPLSGNYIIIADTKNINLYQLFSIEDFILIDKNLVVEFKTPIKGVSIKGVVTEKYNIPSENSLEPKYYVKISLDKSEIDKLAKIPYGAVLDGEIVLDKKENVLTVPVNTILSEKDGNYLMVLNSDGKANLLPVIIGEKSGINVEISGNINESFEVVIKEVGSKKNIELKRWVKNILNIK